MAAFKWKSYRQYLGIIAGALYGLIIRLVLDPLHNDVHLYDSSNLLSVTFIWITPIIIGIFPIIIARKEILDSKTKAILFPVFSVILFFIFTLMTGLEDLFCILVFSLPFVLGAAIASLLTVTILKKIESKKLYSLLLLPLIMVIAEHQFNPKTSHHIRSHTIEIRAPKELVWSYLIEVPPIRDDEYERGFYQFVGIPRPVKSTIHFTAGETYRLGYFSDELILIEKIIGIDTFNRVEFELLLNKSHLRGTPTDQHIITDNYFEFGTISYQLESAKSQTRLTLSCTYTITSRMNGYANLWAEDIIHDFEKRLLNSLKMKIEQEGPRD